MATQCGGWCSQGKWVAVQKQAYVSWQRITLVSIETGMVYLKRMMWCFTPRHLLCCCLFTYDP